jgi:LmbE family N-acetylglucosaminyl deacetylase
MKRLLLSSFIIISALSTIPAAQMRVVPLDDEQGHVALGLVLRHLANAGIFMHTTAHPDDENNGLLVMLNRGQGYRTALATATRGNGGQNEIGPEIFEALGVLRTGELAALHRFDGAEQYFTRAVDFGYSFGIDETFEKWGREEITADYVRLIRTIRPDVIVTLPPTGNAGGQHHMASAVITRDAYKLAGDPSKFPEQIKEGLHAWQPKKLYHLAAFGFPGEPPPVGRVIRVSSGGYDQLLGKTYNEIGSEARSMHKCQGMGQLLSLPAPATAFAASYQLVETTLPAQMQKDETSLFEGVDSSVQSLAKFAGARAPKDLTDGLNVIASATQAAEKAFDSGNDEATLKPLQDGLFAVRVLRRSLRSMPIEDAGRFEIEFRLRQKESEFQQAVMLAHGIKIEALADDGVVVPGQPVKVNVIVGNRGTGDITVKNVKFEGFQGDPSTGSGQGTSCAMTAFNGGGFFFPGASRRPAAAEPPMPTVRKDQVAHCEPTPTIPADARASEPYWHRKGEEGRYTFDADAPFGLPMRPSPFYVQVTLAIAGGEEVIEGLPVLHRYEGDIFSGEKRSELLVVPAFSVRVTPSVAIVPDSAIRSTRTSARPDGRALQGSASGRTTQGSPTSGGRPSGRPAPSGNPAPAVRVAPPADAPTADREIRVTVLNDTTGPADTSVKLVLPQGWSATPGEQPVKFARSDESQTVRFTVKPSSSVSAGEFHVKAVVSADGKEFARGFEVIEYPHIQRYHIYDEAEATLKVINVRTPSDLLIGYVMGVGDQVPPAIEQLGAKVQMLTADDLAWGDLSRFSAIVTGVRAYERRDDLRANNSRLLDYVFKGGTMIVQYNKFEFNDAQYGPYPAKVSANRITDENAPVQPVGGHSPLLTTPNEIGDAAWKNWVQERGTYFLADDKDSRYHDVLQMEDNFPYNKGVKTGALVDAAYGKGHWVYVGLGLWRQLPVGTDGAYQILANLISLGKK